jgi:hypothetical protein
VTEGDRYRSLALAEMFAEDIAISLSIPFVDLSQTYRDFAEAAAMFLFSVGELEKTACTGALLFTATKLP